MHPGGGAVHDAVVGSGGRSEWDGAGADGVGKGLRALRRAVGYGDVRAGVAEGEGDAAGGSARTHEEEALAGGGESRLFQGGHEAAAVGVVAGEAAAVVDDRVDGADLGGEGGDIVEEGEDGLLVRDGDIRAEAVRVAEGGDAGGEGIEGGLPALVGRLNAGGAEGCALDDRREGVGDGRADNAEAGSHRSILWQRLGLSCSSKEMAKQCEPSSLKISTA